MITPTERTKVMRDTRALLQMLARADVITVDGLIQTAAVGLLRHYPRYADLDESATTLPGIWATTDGPTNRSEKAPGSEGGI